MFGLAGEKAEEAGKRDESGRGPERHGDVQRDRGVEAKGSWWSGAHARGRRARAPRPPGARGGKAGVGWGGGVVSNS